MKEIAKEYQIEWDTTESEKELLKPPEELIGGPSTFVSASRMPVNPSTTQSMETNELPTRSSVGGKSGTTHFEDSASAAEAAAESAKKAIAAAEVAAYLAKKEYGQAIEPSVIMDDHFKAPGKMYKSRSLPRSIHNDDTLRTSAHGNGESIYRRHRYNPTSAQSSIQFDGSDCDEEIAMEEPSGVSPPSSSHFKQDSNIHVHPKLPDYDELAARFPAMKFKKSKL